MKSPARVLCRHTQIHEILTLWFPQERLSSKIRRQTKPHPHWESCFTTGKKEFPLMTIDHYPELLLISASDVRYWFYNTPTEIYPGEMQHLVDIWRKVLAAEKKRVRYWTKLLTPVVDLAIKRHKLRRHPLLKGKK